ncbi:hypothetical protein [Paraburkholderia susongensis]|uniref:Uncharacterized protein n=1 Tax=Paraburkholderia susongensis TaxID=1515439 RepID=A0A1X7L8J6_9BURK|nr:hypothetical protein [Paraburkholderia susongensis]SMG49602.1 hypothetical protein SAMN06265784_105150 [Paraburkholderia susongensis]
MKSDDPSFSKDALSALRFESQLASAFLSRTFSGLTAVAFRELGEGAVNELWHRVLTSHQGERYEEGLRKLGIENDPAAVAAAKYHYFTNIIGGLEMEYVEESERKVWIRYLAPMWTYAGVALMAMPASVRRTVFGAWHPRNGRYMGNPRLGFVATKFSMDGDPYDEGYFYEYDRDLREDETYRIEVVRHTPRFDPARAPTLDADLWPEPRILKARPKFSAGYVQATIDSLYWMIGELRTHQIVRSTMRMLAIQLGPQFVAQTGVETKDVASILRFHQVLLKAMGREASVESTGASSGCLHLHGYKPFDERYPPELHQAFFEFHSMVTRMISGTVKITRQEKGSGETWELVDTGNWLY